MVVLLVDDEPFFRTSVKTMLQREGFQVVEAGDGIEACEILQKTAGIDLVIADLLMPRMDGVKVGEMARKQRADMPILLMTGYGLSIYEQAGGFGFLHKPFNRQALVQAIRELVPNAEVRPEQPGQEEST